MTWGSGPMLDSPPSPLTVARRQALIEARRWHDASIAAGVLCLLAEDGPAALSWWTVFVGMTTLASLALDRYAHLRAVSAAAYGVGHAH